MNDERRPVAGTPSPRTLAFQSIGRWWTEADAAELDVLIFELVSGYFEDRERCEACRTDSPQLDGWIAHLQECAACRGDAPLTYGLPCSRKAEFIAHGDACPRCNPCPRLRKGIEVVLEWRQARELRSRDPPPL